MSSNTTVGENINAPNANWSFKGQVAENFPTHVKRSVPYYADGHDLILKVSDYFIQKDSLAYDLGVSTGTLINNLAEHHEKSTQWIGIDCEADMITQAQDSSKKHPNISLLHADICLEDFQPCDMHVAYYTMQFIAPRYRQELFNKIYTSLNWGGAFILFEKVRGPDARFQDIFTGLYNDYKLEQGYDGNEILNKSRSLKGVLEPFSEQGNIDLLKRAGFSDISCVFRYLCFAGFVAIK